MSDGIKSPPGFGKGEAWTRYVDSCNDYLKRQILIYQNWPQRKFNTTGYTAEKVFTDQNA